MRDGAPLYEDSDVCARVAEIGQKIVAASGNKHGFSSFYVLNSSDVTAFSAPGGHVYVTTGLLRHLRSEDELAATLGHEIAHVNERHLMQTEMTEREKVFWQTMLYIGAEGAAIVASGLVKHAIGNSMNTYTPVPGPMSNASSVAVRGPGGFIEGRQKTPAMPTVNYVVMPQDAGGAQIAVLVHNAVSIGTSRGGAMLLNAFYHGYKDQYEFDADKLAIRYADAAGYNGSSLVHVLERVGALKEIDSLSHWNLPLTFVQRRTAEKNRRS